MAFVDFGGNAYDPIFRHLMDMKDICEEKGAAQEIRDGIIRALNLFQDRQQFCETISSTPSDTLLTIAKETKAHPFQEAKDAGKTKWFLNPVMLTAGLEGEFLKSVVSMTNAKRVLELGMYTGYSALSCAEALPADGEVITCEFDPYLESIARDFFAKSEHGNKIKIRIGPAKDTMLELAKNNEKFDVIFIDANKDQYTEYYQIIMDNNLLAKRGTILLDNSLFFCVPYIDEAARNKDPRRKAVGMGIKECMDFLAKDDRVHKVLVPIRDGVCIVRRKEDVEGSTTK